MAIAEKLLPEFDEEMVNEVIVIDGANFGDAAPFVALDGLPLTGPEPHVDAADGGAAAGPRAGQLSADGDAPSRRWPTQPSNPE